MLGYIHVGALSLYIQQNIKRPFCQLFINCPSASVSQSRRKVRWIVTLNNVIFKSCGMISHACCILCPLSVSLGWNSCQATSARKQPDICHILWHSVWHTHLAYEHCDLALAAEVRQETLWSRGCSSGPAGNTLLQFGFSGKHCDLALAAEVRRGTLWCCSSPAGNTAI